MNMTYVFLGVAAIVLLYQIVSGWRQGVARQLVSLIAIVSAYLVAWLGASIVMPFVRAAADKFAVKYPDLVFLALSGAVLGAFTFLVIKFIGAVLFKKTDQQSVGVVRFLYGLGGAALGIVFGVVALWACAIGVKVLGSLAEVAVKRPVPVALNAQTRLAPGAINAPTRDASGAVNSTRPAQGGAAKASRALPPAWLTGLAEAKETLDKSPASGMVKTVDPIPEKVYVVLEKTAQMTTSPDSMQRFLSFPGADALSKNPKVVALRNDPDITELVQKQQFMALLQHPKLVAAANDPTVAQLVKKFDLEKALDYALGPK